MSRIESRVPARCQSTFLIVQHIRNLVSVLPELERFLDRGPIRLGEPQWLTTKELPAIQQTRRWAASATKSRGIARRQPRSNPALLSKAAPPRVKPARDPARRTKATKRPAISPRRHSKAAACPIRTPPPG